MWKRNFVDFATIQKCSILTLFIDVFTNQNENILPKILPKPTEEITNKLSTQGKLDINISLLDKPHQLELTDWVDT